jgi:UDP-N-acetylmuramoyl-L-alanyl-D-glutamate--2,6-diaminopimelate ligase
MADEGVTDVVMEVSSHALDQGRTDGCPFRIAVFTNLSRDHLDYHPSMDAYFEAKSRLFTGLDPGSPKRPAGVINADDPRGLQLAGMTRAEVITYGLGEGCLVRADRLELTRDGISAILRTPVGDADIRCGLIGRFNIYNILAAASAALKLDVDLRTVSAGIYELRGVPGRLELVRNRRELSIAVDYAHTPDALLRALESLRRLTAGRILTVFGCGGDRDRGKRGEMGVVAAGLSDVVIVTSDNPRSEDPGEIAAQIEAGLLSSGMKRMEGVSVHDPEARGYRVEVDRAKAIQLAVAMAGGDDFVLIAGKGHEDYQIIGNTRRHFDDREAAAAAAGGLP